MSVAVCLLNYNSYKDTIECLDSLLIQVDVEYSIVVVDNCSTNESVVEIEKHIKGKVDYLCIDWNNVKKSEINSESSLFLIKSNVNNGFGSGNNIAIQFVQHYLNCDYIMLLNNDTIVPENFLNIMLQEYQRFITKKANKIALGTQEMDYYTDKRRHQGFQYLNLLTGLTFNKNIFPCFKYICGACIMLDKDAPLMDEEYFLYFEDADYAKILKAHNYKLYVVNKTYYKHKLSATTEKHDRKTEIYFESMWRFFKKHYPLYVPFLLVVRYLIHLFSSSKKNNKFLLKTYKSR